MRILYIKWFWRSIRIQNETYKCFFFPPSASLSRSSFLFTLPKNSTCDGCFHGLCRHPFHSLETNETEKQLNERRGHAKCMSGWWACALALRKARSLLVPWGDGMAMAMRGATANWWKKDKKKRVRIKNEYAPCKWRRQLDVGLFCCQGISHCVILELMPRIVRFRHWYYHNQ